MRPSASGMLLCLLVLSSHAVSASEKISATVSTRLAVDDAPSNSIAADPVPVMQTDPASGRQVQAAGSFIMTGVLGIIVLYVISQTYIAVTIHVNMPKDATEHSEPSPLGKHFVCRNWLECYLVPAVFVALVAALWGVYIALIFPKRSSSGLQYRMTETYQTVGVSAGLLCSVVLLASVFVLLRISPNRGTAYVLSFTQSTVFVMTLAIQAGVSALLGEWSPYFSSTHPSDMTISSSMDHLGGALTAVFGASLMAASLPISEALIVHPGNDVAKMSWGRAVRMILAAFCAVGMFWVALSPIKSENLADGIPEERRTQWEKLHSTFAALAFLSMYLYELAVTIDSCNLSAGRHCGLLSYVGPVIGTIAFLDLILTNVLKDRIPMWRELFAIGEYLLALSMPMTVLSRFTTGDMTAISSALLAAYNKRIASMRARVRQQQRDVMEEGLSSLGLPS